MGVCASCSTTRSECGDEDADEDGDDEAGDERGVDEDAKTSKGAGILDAPPTATALAAHNLVALVQQYVGPGRDGEASPVTSFVGAVRQDGTARHFISIVGVGVQQVAGVSQATQGGHIATSSCSGPQLGFRALRL